MCCVDQRAILHEHVHAHVHVHVVVHVTCEDPVQLVQDARGLVRLYTYVEKDAARWSRDLSHKGFDERPSTTPTNIDSVIVGGVILIDV